MLIGTISFGTGKIIGEVMIVNNPRIDYFETGKIMITPKTTVDSINYMKKATAVVTNFGTRLSHAFIVCRDNKIPCIIGTGDATIKFKDGDKVELDLDNKTIKKITG